MAEEIAQLAAKEAPTRLSSMGDFREWQKKAALGGDDDVLAPSSWRRSSDRRRSGRCIRYFGSEHPADLARSLHYAVFGLGDSNLLLDRQTTSAKDCNAVAQRLDKRLIGLGATRWSRTARPMSGPATPRWHPGCRTGHRRR